MVSKEEAIKMLEEGLKIEEEVIPIYSRHINKTMFLSGLERSDQEKVRSILDRLLVDSVKHQGIFKGLLEKVKGSGQDVY